MAFKALHYQDNVPYTEYFINNERKNPYGVLLRHTVATPIQKTKIEVSCIFCYIVLKSTAPSITATSLNIKPRYF